MTKYKTFRNSLKRIVSGPLGPYLFRPTTQAEDLGSSQRSSGKFNTLLQSADSERFGASEILRMSEVTE